jgi:hypothetical protein
VQIDDISDDRELRCCKSSRLNLLYNCTQSPDRFFFGRVPGRTNPMGVSALNWAYEVLIIPLPEIYSLFPVWNITDRF